MLIHLLVVTNLSIVIGPHMAAIHGEILACEERVMGKCEVRNHPCNALNVVHTVASLVHSC